MSPGVIVGGVILLLMIFPGVSIMLMLRKKRAS